MQPHFRSRGSLRALLGGAGLLAAAPALAQQVVHDDFNRPNSTNMGPDWTEQNGDLVIQANQGKGNVFLANDTWMSHTGFAQTYTASKARIDFATTGTGLGGGVGVVLGLTPATWSGTAVLLQDNDLDGAFDRLFFHAAINAGSWYVGGVPVTYDLPVQLSAGDITAWIQDDGDRAVVRIEDASGALVGVYSATGIAGSPFAPTGSAVGVWVRSRPFFDEFWGVEHRELDAYPAALSLAAGGVQTLDVSLGSAHAGELYVVLGSASGSAPGIPVGSVTLPLVLDGLLLYTLGNPNVPPYAGTLGFLDAVGHARARLSIPAASDPSLAGVTLDHAALAFDLSSGSPIASAATNAAALGLQP